MKQNNLAPPAAKIEVNALRAIMKISAASIHINLAINKGLEAAELSNEVLDPVYRKEIKTLADMVTRIRHDSKLLEKRFTEDIKDFFYDRFAILTRINDAAMLMDAEQLELLAHELEERTKNEEIKM